VSRAGLDLIADALGARSEEIIGAGVAAIREKIPAYSAMDEAQLGDVRAGGWRPSAGAAFRGCAACGARRWSPATTTR
jgi:hypothetical protein